MAPGTAPYLGDIHVHNPTGFVSFGWPEGDVPSMRRGVSAIVARISRNLFFADLDLHQPRLTADAAPDFAETLYATAVQRPRDDSASGYSGRHPTGMCQPGSGVPTLPPPVTAVPVMTQTQTWPLLAFCMRMSALPSPL